MCKTLLRIFSACYIALLLTACESDTDNVGSLVIERDLRLSSLSLNVGEFAPVFSSDNLGPYEIVVDANIAQVEINVGAPAESNGINLLAYRRVTVTSDETDGLADEQVVTANSSVTFSLEPGDNLFGVRVQLNNEEQSLDYLLSVRRISSVAALDNIVFEDFTDSADDALEFVTPSEFSSDVFEYSLSVPFSRCSLGVTAFGADRFTQVETNGQTLPRGEAYFFDLAVGENILNIDVTSEDGSAQNTYRFAVTRAEATSDDNDTNLSISELNFSAGDVASSAGSEGFNCLLLAYALRVDRNQTTVDVSAAPTIASRTLELVNVVVSEDENGNSVTTLENPRELVPGVPLTLTVSDNTDENAYAISVGRDSENALRSNYTFSILRSETNWVYARTGAELQAALQNAQPNQEIVIDTDGELTANSTLAESGKEGVHFFTSASGTAEQPVILRGRNNVTLAGSDLSNGTVLELSGDFWQVRDLNLASSAYGLVLDSASNNVVTDIGITDIGLRGVQLKNGSHDNFLGAVSISSVGAAATSLNGEGQALVVGSDPQNWTTNPVPGAEDPSNLRNVFANFDLGSSIFGEPVVVEAGSNSTTFFGFVIDAGDISVADQNTAVRIQGSNTELVYSTIMDSSNALATAVTVQDINEPWVTEPWAENSIIFDNVISTTNTALVTVASDANVDTVFVDDNTRSDGLDTVYSGEAIDQSFVSPLYAIQWVSTNDDQTYCLQREETTNTVTALDVVLVTAATCDGSQSQQWDLIHEGEQSLVLRSQAAPTAKLSPANDGRFITVGSTGLDTLTLKEDADTEAFAGASSLRWKVNFVDRETVYFTNQFGTAYGITMLNFEGQFATDNVIAAMSPQARAETQIFQLVPID